MPTLMKPLPPGFRSALLAYLACVLFGVVGMALRRWLGLEWLVTAGYVDIVLWILLIALLVFAFDPVRQTIAESIGTLQTLPVLQALATLLCIYAGVLLAMILARLTVGAYSAPPDLGWKLLLSHLPEARLGFLMYYLLLTMFGAILLGPIAEELLFVGTILRTARATTTSRPVILIVNATLFVLLHQLLAPTLLSWTHILSYVGGRVLLDTTYFRTGNLLVPICLHVLHNTLVMTKNLLPFV